MLILKNDVSCVLASLAYMFDCVGESWEDLERQPQEEEAQKPE